MFKKTFLSSAAFAVFFIFSAGYARETDEVQKEDSGKTHNIIVSESCGYFIGQSLPDIFDKKAVIKGFQDSIAGKEPPMTRNEYDQAISLIQEEAFQKLAKQNLDEANTFMANNAKQEGVVVLEKDKLQYKLEKQGEGAVVEAHFSPMIRYTGKFLDGNVFGYSQEDELISLDETIPAFAKAIVGMKEGEKRTIFIHPDLGCGTAGSFPPNSTLVFDIDVVKANASPEQEDSFTSISKEGTREIALPEKNSDEAVR